MKIADIISEAKQQVRILDLRYIEPSDPSLVLKHWGSHPKEYINPSSGFFWHWNQGRLILHSERNDEYSWKMVQLLRANQSGETVRPVEKWLRSPAGKIKKPFDLWNMLNGKVDLDTGVITIHKEHASGSGSERQRAINDLKELQDLLRFLMRYGVGTNFKVKGVPSHVDKTVDRILAQSDPTSKILSGGAPIMYHGTSQKRWEEIQKHGLRPGKTGKVYIDLVPGYSEYNVYLTTNPKTADFYAKRQAKKDGDNQGVILQVTVPDPARLLSDDYFLPRGSWSDDEQRLIPPEPGATRRRAGEKWPVGRSGRDLGSFAYHGRIPPSYIKAIGVRLIK